MKTHVTVIPSDGIIAVDGEVLFLDGITSETFHALQWHDGAGHVEPGTRSFPPTITPGAWPPS
ncbi:hypothetical protein [Desulfovibrio sp.]|uniref:hypothetical protein n=1 Tax=Desulfovibrio sp. TaxID=885 RepID=UPI002A7652A2|nr:hypothetical protein [Desulfovibrio sp.]MDY2666557.1 hypothetical protein [Desulfovibrio sp.]MDY5395408.1 hypothetical protein [Desulfovibrio sp.]